MAEKGNREFIIGIYSKSDRDKFAIGAYNFSTLDILKGIHDSAVRMKAPVIVSNSEGERGFFGRDECVAMYNLLRKRHPQTILHADHTKTFDEAKRVIDAGFPSVHFDGSELEYDVNVRETKRVVEYAHNNNVFVEGELGGIRGGSTLHPDQTISEVWTEAALTKPEQAAEYVKATGVDSLAISIGNVHGIWKDAPKLDFERIIKIKELTGKFLVLHGGSGITPADFRKAILCGINKININTDIRLAYEKALLQGLGERKDDVPYHYLSKVAEAVGKAVEEKIIIFKTEGKA
ncbi:class II fructose-bisphosphate aldolase [Candidatus Woesearchaeota archaeon]|nr:class II fructose-bisphosphate aldolase [Candidatus Woesearchaeota archaeon]